VEGSVISSERDDALLPIGGADDKWPLPRAAMWDKRACTASVVNMVYQDGNCVNLCACWQRMGRKMGSFDKKVGNDKALLAGAPVLVFAVIFLLLLWQRAIVWRPDLFGIRVRIL
jgi:hypothetical protein